MSIEKIRKAFKELKAECDGLTFVEPQIIDLLSAISEHLLQNSPKTSVTKPADCFITLRDFVKKHKFVAENTLYKLCQYNEEFANLCAYHNGRRWYVEPDKTLEYLKKRPIFKKRLERLGENC